MFPPSSINLLLPLVHLALSAPSNGPPPPPSNPSPFNLKLVQPKNLTYNSYPLKNTYASLDTGDGPLLGFNGAPSSSAVALSLSPNPAGSNLMIDELSIIAYQDAGQTEELLHFDTAANIEAEGGVPAVCEVGTKGGKLKCKVKGGGSHFVLCPGEAVTDDLFLVKVVEEGCVEVGLEVVFVD